MELVISKVFPHKGSPPHASVLSSGIWVPSLSPDSPLCPTSVPESIQEVCGTDRQTDRHRQACELRETQTDRQTHSLCFQKAGCSRSAPTHSWSCRLKAQDSTPGISTTKPLTCPIYTHVPYTHIHLTHINVCTYTYMHTPHTQRHTRIHTHTQVTKSRERLSRLGS